MSTDLTTGEDTASILDLTQGVRLRIIDSLAPVNTPLTTDPDSLRVLLQTLDGADRTELSKMKIKADSKSGDDDRKTALMLAKMAEDRMAKYGNANMFMDVSGSGNIPEPDLSLLPAVTISPGLTDRGHHIEGYDDFVGRLSGATGE
jgi:hypothetical protein